MHKLVKKLCFLKLQRTLTFLSILLNYFIHLTLLFIVVVVVVVVVVAAAAIKIEINKYTYKKRPTCMVNFK
jgi:hypothetical protein